MSAEGKLSPAEYLRRVGMGVANALGQTPAGPRKDPVASGEGHRQPPVNSPATKSSPPTDNSQRFSPERSAGQASAQGPRTSSPASAETPETSINALQADIRQLLKSNAQTVRPNIPLDPISSRETEAPPLSPASGDRKLNSLFERVENLLGPRKTAGENEYFPPEPTTLYETRLTEDEVERLILKFLLAKGSSTGRQVAGQLKLPFALIEPIVKGLKQDTLLAYRNTAEMGDYEYCITDVGRERARRFMEECTYFGAAPVSLRDYLHAMEAQSITRHYATEESLKTAFKDLLINPSLLERLGPAINSGRGMFLFGEPGNGKTSIAERITRCFGSTIWIPRALGIDGDVIRLFDPGMHDEVETPPQEQGLFNLTGIDQRWVRIVRPTIVAGGELTMDQLEVTQNQTTKICEAPLQLKSNCGTFVIDDFGRQRMPVTELLNRWIVPLEKRYDFLNLPSGKKIQVPFDQLIIFSTNLEPRDLVDGAFLRRIPYKIQVPDPTEAEFRGILQRLAPHLGFQYNEQAVSYLIQKHYFEVKRPFRSCQPRDLLLQVKNYCTYKNIPKQMTPEAFDFAVANYFSVM
ncbi:AAA ATPase [Planctopirus limnophila DSM 3776]|uniref:AAA ATPase n=2 Tax=Planctopirus limnophila TaxID=120 RepID=D5SUB2_PLAL2|nr:AAA ATPase [Planctopirus limnophila DSM 3776]